jgi:AsmA-like C-terminal region
MARKRIMASLSAVALATVAGLFAAALLPMLFGGTSVPTNVGGTLVQASQRDLYAIEQPLRIAQSPNLLLLSGRLRTDATSSAKPSNRLILDHPVFELEVSGATSSDKAPDKTSSVDIINAPSEIAAALFERLIGGTYDALEVRNGKAIVKTSGVVSETITDINASVTLQRRTSVAAQGSFAIRGLRMEFDGATGLPNAKDPAVKQEPLPVKLALKSPTLNATLDGKLAAVGPLSLTGQVETSIPHLWKLARWLDIAAPENAVLKGVAIKSQLRWAKGVMAFDKAAIDLDGQQATGAVSLSYKAGRPALEGTLGFKAFDVAPYLQAFMAPGAAIETLPTAWTQFETRLPLVLHADADLRVSTPTLMLSGTPIGRGAATLSIRSAKLHADVTEIEINGTKSSMQVTADMNGAYPRYGVRGRVDMTNVGPFLGSVFQKELIDGRGVAQIDLTGVGDNFGQVLRAASGKVSLVTHEGARLAGDLKAIKASTKDGDKTKTSEAGWGAIANGQSPLDAFDVRLDIANGAGVIRKGALQSAGEVHDATGRIDFVARQIDLQIKASPIKQPAAKQLKTAAAPGGASVSLRGPWEHPSVTTEPGR